MDPSREKAAEWKSKMKKGDILVTIQNTTNYRLELTTSLLREGKFFKKSEVINTVLPMGIEEMGFVAKSQGEFVWQLAEAEPGLNQLRLIVNGKDTTAKCEEVPASASWQVDLQQSWQKAPAHVLLTLLNRSDPEPLNNSSKGGKKKSPKKKAAVPEAVDMAATAKALTGDNNDSDSDSDSWGPPQKKISIIIKNNPGGTEQASADDDLRSMVSRLSLGGGVASTGSRQSLTGSTDSPKPSRRAATRGAEMPPADDDFFNEIARSSSGRNVGSAPSTTQSMTEEEQLQMALAISQSEAEAAVASAKAPKEDSKKKSSGKSSNSKGKSSTRVSSPSPPAASSPSANGGGSDASEAVTDFTSALTDLDQGKLESATALLARALEKLPKDPNVAQQIQPVVHEWAAYRLLIALLMEMNKLEKDRLWAQRALLSKFAALVATSGAITLSEHRLVTLRMAINRNMEVGNFYTAAEFIRVMQSTPNLSPEDAASLQKKFEVCRQHGTENAIPTGATYDPNTGVLIDGRRLIMCTRTMRLIRGAEFSQCSRCRATFSPTVNATSCVYCNGPVVNRQM